MYDHYRHLNGYVLAPAIEEINTVTDYTVSMVPIKKGRKVEELEFFIERKKQAGLQLEESESDMELRCELERIGFDADAIRDITKEDPERALLAARRTREKEAANAIDTSPAAYFMGIFRRKGEIKLDADKPKKEPQKPAALSDAELEKDERAGAKNSAAAELTTEEQHALRDEFIASHPGAKVNPTTQLVGGLMASSFRAYMNERAAHVIAVRQ
jgi:plasmid replication initiation protein